MAAKVGDHVYTVTMCMRRFCPFVVGQLYCACTLCVFVWIVPGVSIILYLVRMPVF